MLSALKRYRHQMDFSPFPLPGETTPLVKKMIGQGPMTSTRQIRSIVQTCFDFAIDRLLKDGFSEDAEQMKAATVHWLYAILGSQKMLNTDRESMYVMMPVIALA